MVFCQLTHLSYISHVRLSLTRTGALNLLGNKGSVALRATIYGKRFIFIAAHFSAHKHNEYNRMMNYHASLKDLLFRLPQTADDESEIVRTYAAAVGDSYIGNFSIVDASCVKGKSTWDRFLNTIENETLRLYYNIQETHEILYDWESHILDQHDYVFFLGDLNSRLHNLPSATIFEMIEADMVDQLLCHDELRQGMVSGEVFDGFQEQWIKFHPTYKFDKGTSRYDTSRKKRDPAWCDRILFRILENNPYTSPSGSRINRTSSSGEFVASPLVLSGGVGRHNTDDSSGLQTEESSSLLRTVQSAPYQSTPVSVDSKENWVSLENLSDEQLQLIVDKQEKGIHSSSSTTSDESVGLTRGKSAFVGHAPERGPLQEESAFIEPNHPVWKRKRGFPTFRAATKSIFAKPPADTDDDVSPSVPQRPFPMIKNAINALQYYRVEELTMSDHKPVGGTFEVKVVHLPLEVMDRLLVGIGNLPEQD
ncbi:inositol 5-phosphatase-like protein [Angomonas deanei]|nr:inositol 5-phosphatase-like protein [Angomonas deanei]|eukprot:EPY30645.1 inositol 5-phosphatase-like protein [Angomonas deanei]